MQIELEQPSMKMLRMMAVILLASAVMLSSACKKKKPNVPAAAPPTITAPEPQPSPPTPSTTTIPNPEPTETTTITPPAPKPKPRRRLSHKPKQPPTPVQPAPQQQTQQAKSNSGDAMTISPNLPQDEVDSQKRATEQLLQTAEANLRNLTRQLSDGEQNMARQVRNYITQSRLATQDGDLERAHNLAVKAQLLSAELTK
jgi:outer membrane biosynthesis protein TonB